MDALAGDVHCGPADVEVHDLGVEPAQLLGQEHGAVAGAATGDQHAEAVVEAASAAKAVVIDHAQVVEPRADEPHTFILGLAFRIRKALVLALDLRILGGGHGSQAARARRGTAASRVWV